MAKNNKTATDLKSLTQEELIEKVQTLEKSVEDANKIIEESVVKIAEKDKEIDTLNSEKVDAEKLIKQLSKKLESKSGKVKSETVDYKGKTYVIRLKSFSREGKIINLDAETLAKDVKLIESIMSIKGQNVLQELADRPESKKK